jgi:hypothetical protein
MVALLLCLILILPLFRRSAVAFFDIPLPGHAWDSILESRDYIYIPVKELREKLVEIIKAEIPQFPTSGNVDFYDGRAIFRVRGAEHIQIGEYIFDRHYFHNGISVNDVFESQYTGHEVAYVMFFVHNGDIWFDWRLSNFQMSTRPHYEAFRVRYEFHDPNCVCIGFGINIPSMLMNHNLEIMRHSMRFNASHDYLFRVTPHFDNFTYSLHTSNYTTCHAPFGVPGNHRIAPTVNWYPSPNFWLRWINVSQVRRANRRPTDANTGALAQELTLAITQNARAFNELGHFGMFRVPAYFHNWTGMTFTEYVNTLNTVDLFRANEDYDVEIVFPPELQPILDADDGDMVELRRNPDGTVTVNITRGAEPKCCCYDDTELLSLLGQIRADIQNGFNRVIDAVISIPFEIFELFRGGDSGGTDPPPPKCCCYDDTEVRSVLGQILAEVRGGFNRVVNAVDGVTLNIAEFFGIGDIYDNDDRPWWQRIVDSVGNITLDDNRIVNYLRDILTEIQNGFDGMLNNEYLLEIRNNTIPIFGMSEHYCYCVDDCSCSDNCNCLECVIEEVEDDLRERLRYLDEATEFYSRFLEILAGGGSSVLGAYIDDDGNHVQSSRASTNKAPVFEIDFVFLGQRIKGTIDLNFMNPYMPYLQGIIVAFSYAIFARKVIRRTPSMIRGYERLS